MTTPAFTHYLQLTPDGVSEQLLGVPASPGVAVFETDNGEPITLLTSADLRQLARTRLDPKLAGTSGNSLAGLATSLRWQVAESEGERQALWLHYAHDLLPRLADEGAKTPPCWFLRLDARDEHPTPSPLTPRDLCRLDDLDATYGPYATRKQAARAGEAVVDALDLCRHRHLLVLTPNASACAYKDMGRCPAPCDGTEPLNDYRERVREGQCWLEEARSKRAHAEEEMHDAASALDYERAAHQKALLDRSAPLVEGVAGALAGKAWCVVLPSATEGRVRLVLCAGGAVSWIEEDSAPGALPDDLASPSVPGQRDARAADTLAWVGGLACLPEELNFGRRACRVVAWPASADALRRAAEDVVERAARQRTSVE